jgi:hypothetical protein
MNKLIEIRNQELMCRDRALLDSERREFWLRRQKSGDSALLMRLLFILEKAMAFASRPTKASTFRSLLDGLKCLSAEWAAA